MASAQHEQAFRNTFFFEILLSDLKLIQALIIRITVFDYHVNSSLYQERS